MVELSESQVEVPEIESVYENLMPPKTMKRRQSKYGSNLNLKISTRKKSKESNNQLQVFVDKSKIRK